MTTAAKRKVVDAVEQIAAGVKALAGALRGLWGLEEEKPKEGD
ncbi:MAG: hypothetical protein AAF581_11075 [Planctomycetota bacterium]